MSSEPKIAPQEKIFQFCPFCGEKYDEKVNGNIEIKCPECQIEYKVKKL